MADEASGTTRMHSYDYDARGRLVSVSGGGADATVTYAAGLVRIEDAAGVFEYEVDDRGRVAWVRQGAGAEIRVERDRAGDVVGISQDRRSVRFGRDELGRIVDAAFTDGSSARYRYDSLGNRAVTQHGDGSTVTFSYDATGNVTRIDMTGRAGAAVPASLVVPSAEGSSSRGDILALAGMPSGAWGLAGSGTAEPTWTGQTAALTDDGSDALLMYGSLGIGTAGSGAYTQDRGVPPQEDARELVESAGWMFRHGAAGRDPQLPERVFRPPEYRWTEWHAATDSDDPCEVRDTEGEAIARQVDACIRQHSSHTRLPRIDPYTLDFKDLGGSWGVFEHPAGCRADRSDPPPDSCWYKTYLDLKRLRRKEKEDGTSLKTVILETLTHEYAHHIIGNPDHGRYFESHLARVRRGTQACDD